MAQQSVEGQIGAGAGLPVAVMRLASSRVYRIANTGAGYRRAAEVYGELANHARCLALTYPSLANHYDRTRHHWLHWQRRCLQAADLHDQRRETTRR